MLRPAFLIITMLLIWSNLPAQNPREEINKEPERNYVIRDDKVDYLLKAHREINEKSGMNGFRVQIYRDSGNRSKLRTDRVKAEFDAKFPNVRSYISYDEPYYRLRVGDFRTRLDALRFLNQISSTYLSAIIVPDKINFPQLEKTNPGIPKQDENEPFE
ncbi:MAG: SPOR domain-containing protein [Bacteroidetes bacterium]|nr:MAG: SPOR domain-containing protein [Bacteroidota bacterium]